MKSILTLWLMLLVSHPSLPAQSQTEYNRLTSERIGLTISLQQRNYLMLFTDVEGFKDATFTVHNDSTVGITIHRTTADTTFTLQTQTARDLAFYIDNFERIYANEQSYKVDCDLSRIRHLLQPLQRYRFHPNAESASAKLRNGGFIEGEIIAATNDVLIFWPAGVPYDWKKASTLARPVHFSEIEVLDAGKKISMRGKKSVFDSFTDYLRPNLSFYSPQRENLPPELLTLLATIQPTTTETLDQQDTLSTNAFSHPESFMLRVYASFPVGMYNSYTHRRFNRKPGLGQPPLQESMKFDKPARATSITVKATCILSDQWRLGARVSYAATPVFPASVSDGFSMKGTSIGIVIDKVLTRYNPVSPSFWGNVESDISLSVQNHFYTVSIFSRNFYNVYEGVDFPVLEQQQSQNLLGIDLSATLGYRLWETVNIFTGIELSLFPSLIIDEYEQTFNRYGRKYEYGWQGGAGTYLEGCITVGASLFL